MHPSPLGIAASRRALARTMVVASLLVAVPAAARAQAAPGPLAAMSASAVSLRDSLVALARAQIGRRYVLGGQSPDRGFDCSGLVRYITAALHLQLPRTARQQAHAGLAVARDTSRLLPGDLLTFGRGKRGVSHVGIYIGDGRFVHASTRAGRVIESRLDRPLYKGVKPWLGVRRLIAASDDSAATARDHTN
jgi:cell wall-associated NlpC family hydrolase